MNTRNVCLLLLALAVAAAPASAQGVSAAITVEVFPSVPILQGLGLHLPEPHLNITDLMPASTFTGIILIGT